MKNRKKLKQDKQRLTRLAEESITVESFLANYLGIRDNSTLSNQISHQDIKKLLPQLVRPSFDYVLDYPDLIYNGEVLLVEDSYGSVVPYFNPLFLREKKDGEFEELVASVKTIECPNEDMAFIGEYVEETKIEEIPDINTLELSELSNYELQQLLRLYSKNNVRSAYRKVREELRGRKDSRHAAKESKERVLSKRRNKKDLFDY
jgi:hypothetical protein